MNFHFGSADANCLATTIMNCCDYMRIKRSPCQQRAEPIAQVHGKAAAQAGFTLVEVLVVLSIMAAIMGLVGPRVLGYLNDSKLKAARIQAETLSSAVELFYIDNGRYPLDSEGLQALVAPPANLPTWNGPYIKGRTVPLDPWGAPYRYATHDRGVAYSITFVGAEGRPTETGDPRTRTGALRDER